jgi:uncharacterized protein (TIGR03083 family)
MTSSPADVRLAPSAYLEHLRTDGERLAEAATDLDAAIAVCPGWTVRDAVEHTAEVYSHKLAVLRLGRWPKRDEWMHEPPPGTDSLGWYRAQLTELAGELARLGPDAPSANWVPAEPQTTGFWFRRMAQETAVHRVDVESARDTPAPVADDLAVDGIDEVLLIMLAGEWSEVSDGPGSGETVAVRTGDHVWRTRLDGQQVAVDVDEGGALQADAVVSGEPSELLLWLWGRRPDAAVHVEGSTDAARVLRQCLERVTG